MTRLRGDDEIPELPANLETFYEWLWNGDKDAWRAARIEWMRQNMTVEEIVERMTRRRLAYRARTAAQWRRRLELEAESDDN